MKIILDKFLLISLILKISSIYSFDNFNKEYKKPLLLTDETIREHIVGNTVTFVLYYAPW
jgi:hypothetical protein